MEFIYVVLFLIVIIMLFNQKNSHNTRLERLEQRLAELNNLLKQSLVNRPAEAPKQAPTVAKPVDSLVPVPPEIPKQQVIAPPTRPEPVVLPDTIERTREVISEPVAPLPAKAPEPRMPPPPLHKPYTAPEPQRSFLEQHPDLEKFIGENLINKIGIAILVLAIGFFVKYAIDNNWVGPVGRVGIGVLCGGILIGIAHRMRNAYTAFSSVLVGGGLAILYFTITLAYHQFHLFNQTTSFIILIVITIFSVILSLLYNKQELAVIALVGGLASPFMVSSGEANYNALFIYLVILNAGLLVIAYYKSWRILNATVFGLTVIVFGAVLTSLTGPSYHTGLLYASILYLMFFAINVANNVKENKAFMASDFSILLINTSLYFAVGLYLLTAMHLENMRGLFSASLAVVNLLLSYTLFKNKKVDTNILYLLIGITLTFISLTAPIQLNGHYITLFWGAEAVLLYWLYLKSRIQLMKLTSLVVWGAMLISLLMDWNNLYLDYSVLLPVIANKGFITTIVAAISSYLLYVQIKKDETPQIYNLTIPANGYRITAFVLLFLSGVLEISHQFLTRYPNTDLNYLYLALYVPLFVFVFHLVTKRLNTIGWATSGVLTGLCIIAYMFTLPTLFGLQSDMLTRGNPSTGHLAAHWLAAAVVVLLFYQIVSIVRQHLKGQQQATATWVIVIVIVTFLSAEFCLAANSLFYSKTMGLERIGTIYSKVGLPILWGLSSFALMLLGMRNKVRTLRVVSLTLFAVTLGKLFIFDIRDIPPAGKIAAFFCLGVLLLIVSFMYQRVKKILVEDEAKKKPDEE